MTTPSDRALRAAALRLLEALENLDCTCELLKDCPCEESCLGEEALACPCCRGECDHPPLALQPRCHHQLAREERYRLTVGEWGELCSALCPEDYDEPPEAPAGADVLSIEAVVGVYARRRRAGLRIFCPRDLRQRSGLDDTLRVGPVVSRAGNGYDVQQGEVAVAGRVGPRAEPSLVEVLLAEMGEGQRALFEYGRELAGRRVRSRQRKAVAA